MKRYHVWMLKFPVIHLDVGVPNLLPFLMIHTFLWSFVLKIAKIAIVSLSNKALLIKRCSDVMNLQKLTSTTC